MAITFKALQDCLPFVSSIRKPIMLRSRHGVGKSMVVYEYAKTVNLPVIERRVSQMTEGDILGLPKVNDGKTEWLLPDWVLTACEQPVVLFLDELDRGQPEVRQAFFELADSRKVAGHYLHEDTLIFAAINGGESASQYQVGELDPAELDRWTVFDVSPSVEDWLNWANGKVHPIVWDFINQNNSHLEHLGEFEPNKVYPSRRSWHRFSDCLAKGGNSLISEGTINATLLNLVTAFCGFEAAVSFGDFVKNYKFQVTAEDILDKGKIDLTSRFQINDHLALVEKLTVHLSTSGVLSSAQLKNLASYFVALPSEIAMTLLESVGHSKEGNKNIVAFHKLPEVRNRISEILTTKKEEETKKEEPQHTSSTKSTKKNKK